MTTNLTQIVDAISKKQFVAAQDMLSDAIQEKLSDSLISRKDEVALDFGQEVTNEEKDYDAFFQKAMKKFGISSPADLKTDEKKKEWATYRQKLRDLTKTVTPKFLPNSPKIDESEFPTEPS